MLTGFLEDITLSDITQMKTACTTKNLFSSKTLQTDGLQQGRQKLLCQVHLTMKFKTN